MTVFRSAGDVLPEPPDGLRRPASCTAAGLTLLLGATLAFAAVRTGGALGAATVVGLFACRTTGGLAGARVWTTVLAVPLLAMLVVFVGVTEGATPARVVLAASAGLCTVAGLALLWGPASRRFVREATARRARAADGGAETP